MEKKEFRGARVNKPNKKKPERAEIICFSNDKGGVAKSTSVQVVCEALVQAGFKVLGIDLDLSSNFSTAVPFEKPEGYLKTSEVAKYIIDGGTVTKDVIKRMICKTEAGYDVIMCDHKMAVADQEYGRFREAMFLVKKITDVVRDEYHYIVLDTQPNVYYLTKCAYCAADKIYAPTEPTYESVKGILNVYLTAVDVKKECNPTLEIGGMFFTKVDKSATTKRVMLRAKNLSEQTGIKICEHHTDASLKYKSNRDYHLPYGNSLFTDDKFVDYLWLTNEITGKQLFIPLEETV